MEEVFRYLIENIGFLIILPMSCVIAYFLGEIAIYRKFNAFLDEQLAWWQVFVTEIEKGDE